MTYFIAVLEKEAPFFQSSCSKTGRSSLIAISTAVSPFYIARQKFKNQLVKLSDLVPSYVDPSIRERVTGVERVLQLDAPLRIGFDVEPSCVEENRHLDCLRSIASIAQRLCNQIE